MKACDLFDVWTLDRLISILFAVHLIFFPFSTTHKFVYGPCYQSGRDLTWDLVFSTKYRYFVQIVDLLGSA
jgi:hypothetical protein